MKDNNLDNLRHSASHLLAAAVENLYKDAKRAIGPATKDGFYYDFDFGDAKVGEEDLSKIEKEMKKIVSSWNKFEKTDLSANDLEKIHPNNPYKKELVDELKEKNEDITFYKSGEFIDLCRGGHIDNPAKNLKHFKLLSVAGAYWRGDENNKMLTRIYGTAFSTKEELEKYLWQLEEAKKRDHRKIGKELDLFEINEDVGPGLAIWLPKGNVIKEELENWAKETESEWGYKSVSTPHITKEGLYHTSGHLPYYKGDMFPPMELDDGQNYYLKPMNCPHHHMVYSARPKSYRDLPLRLAEYGMCYRYEASGELFGLMRVRGLDINDAHIYCTLDQAVEEFASVMKLHEYYYKSLGIEDYYLEMALRDPNNTEKYHGDEEMWQLAEKLMREAVKKVNIEMVEEEGSAAFYGPKIDFIVKSSIGREFAVSTNQIDLYMGDRFDLKYAGSDGTDQTPVIIHRAPLGSHERFIGFLIEHFDGKFPLWLSPVHIKLLTISEDEVPYAKELIEKLSSHNLRVELDDSDKSLGKKLALVHEEKMPYIGIVGQKEAKEKTITVKDRSGQQNTYNAQELIDKLAQEIETKAL